MTRIHRTTRPLVLLAVLAAGCSFGDSLEDYYSGGGGPSVSSLDRSVEEGNIGGGTVTISGSNFGDDPALITVLFGSQNAEIISVSDSTLEVVVPRGPIEGGAVDVVIGTADGQVRASEAYTYDTRMGMAEDIFANQAAYIAVTDDYFSCGGGVGNVIANPALMSAFGWDEVLISEGYEAWEDESADIYSPYETFCNEGLVFGGYVGISGRAEVLDFKYPRLHSVFGGYRNGFGGAFDLSPNVWSVQKPAQEVVSVDIEGFYEDQRVEVDSFVLRNLDVVEAYAEGSDERTWCADLSALVSVEYEGSDTISPYQDCPYSSTTVNAPYYRELEGDDCDTNQSYAKVYDLAEMEFCQIDEYENTRSFQYDAEWPVGEYFFKGPSEDGTLDYFEPTRLSLNVPEAGISDVEIMVPEAAVFTGETGWNTDAFGVATQPALKGTFSLTGLRDTCADSDGNGESTGSDVVATVEWKPASIDVSQMSFGDEVVGARTFVRFSLAAAGMGWFGTEGTVMKATITVPDTHNYSEELEKSVLEIPASVVYQFPSMLQDFGGTTVGGAGADECGDLLPGATVTYDWAQPDVANYGFVITQVERVTEFVVKAPGLEDQVEGATLGFSYTSGDIGYTVFGTASDGSPSWLNPAEGSTTCGDCSDNDGDGWSDVDDPDCQPRDLDGDGVVDSDGSDLVEDDSRFGITTCNDLIDNDDDGLVDSEDDDCNAATDEETNCRNRTDDDDDGWEDRNDPDCMTGGVGYEGGFSDYECNDGIDNDGDGAIDTEEPECRSPTDRETNCDDGIDNDSDGLVDADDPECQDAYDGVEDEIQDTDTSCNDGLDNDADGWTDLDDPDCPTLLGEEVGFDATYECNDGIDNDLHGDIDVDDPTCQRAGAMSDETPAFTGGCVDGTDNDSDGYTDGGDPDCEYAPFGVERTAFHDPGLYPDVPACYNGVDDDGNADVDALDPDCVDSAGTPSGFVTAEDPARPGCTNGLDDDGDTWIDAADPDCGSGASEVGFGSGECNDGVDNDGNTLVDGEDPGCTDAADAVEGD